MSQFYVIIAANKPEIIDKARHDAMTGTPHPWDYYEGPMSMHNAQIRLAALNGRNSAHVQLVPVVNGIGESLEQDNLLVTDLMNSIAVTIGLWEERNLSVLALYDDDAKSRLLDEALFSLSSPDEGDEDDDEHESIGEEMFENSYIGGGGSPDFENM